MARPHLQFLPLRVSIALFAFSSLVPSDAYDPLDPNGNITIQWDAMEWTPDGYRAVVSLYNYQQYRHIQPPGWKLGWVWARKEIIWDVKGGQATEQGDCSIFKTDIPHCCKKNPEIVDLLPGAPYTAQIANCCKGGVLSSLAQDPVNSAASIQVTVGQAGTTSKSVQLPMNFTLMAPGPGYTCGPAKRLNPPTKFITPDGRRTTQAHMTWYLTCTYSQFVAQRSPTCCISLSSFYNDTIVNCPTCSCGCQNNSTKPGSCVEGNSPYLASVVIGHNKNSLAPLVQCTSHMCPIRVHWHVKVNYKEYWRVKITVTNFNYRMNYSQWNLVVQHPNFDNFTIFSFNYTALNPYGPINDTAMLWGIKYYNDYRMTAGPDGNVQSELLFRKEPSTFTFQKGWAFPRRVYFNGDNCVMPPPDAYPWLPNASPPSSVSFLPSITVWTALASLLLNA